MYSFYIPSPDFLEVGQGDTKEDCVQKMIERAEIVYGGPNNLSRRFAGGVLYDLPDDADISEWSKVANSTQHYIRFHLDWWKVSESVYNALADKYEWGVFDSCKITSGDHDLDFYFHVNLRRKEVSIAGELEKGSMKLFRLTKAMSDGEPLLARNDSLEFAFHDLEQQDSYMYKLGGHELRHLQFSYKSLVLKEANNAT